MANMAVFCDGTWNTPNDTDGGVPSPTNVVRMYNALSECDAVGVTQNRYYHPGVGTDGGRINRLLEGGTGKGLDRNIMSAYKWVSTQYEAGDKLFLLGFSRGAYTVRSLAGMITRCGLLDLVGSDDETAWASVEAVFDCYRHKKTPVRAQRPIRMDGARIEIEFLGVWDTVGALGIPDHLALLNLVDDLREHDFHDTELSAQVRRARHAVAIDELRESFGPTLWSNAESHPDAKEVWFPGVHSNVGGGYGQTGLSDGPLLWMIKQAQTSGLSFRENALKHITPNSSCILHNSWTGVFEKLKSQPRSAPFIHRESVDAGRLHESALTRQNDPPLDQPPYWPTDSVETADARVVEIYARQIWNATGLYLRAGVRYELTAVGQWMDGPIKCGPEGTADGQFHIAEVAHLAASAWGKVETLFQAATGNDRADFWFTRREEALPWFSLVGVVANGFVDSRGNRINSETFAIGQSAEFEPARSGYLFCFANDAWNAYENNRGGVTLTVQRQDN
ncbi:DUF2235 domain-containing protein [Aurantimonas litoralis]|nr:DUF2235 domain-containing protein [Aurantimonas litoralis]